MRGLNASIVHWGCPEQTAAREGGGRRGRTRWTKGFPLLITQSIMCSGVADQMSLKIVNPSFCGWAPSPDLLIHSTYYAHLSTDASHTARSTRGDAGSGVN